MIDLDRLHVNHLLLTAFAALAALGLLAAAPVSEAAERTLTIDPAASRVTFTLGATLHSVKGSFDLVSGTIRFDPETGAASGLVVIDATSGDTEHEGRDRDMHAKVLESDRHPRFELRPSGINGQLDERGSGQLTLAGELTVRGTAHPVEIEAQVESDGDGTLRATGSFTVPYVEWGMKDPSKFVLRVDKTVQVRIEAVGELADD